MLQEKFLEVILRERQDQLSQKLYIKINRQTNQTICFPEDFRNEVQVLPTVLSYDNENEADILSIIACSAALSISGLPFKGPVGASRVGFIK